MTDYDTQGKTIVFEEIYTPKYSDTSPDSPEVKEDVADFHIIGNTMNSSFRMYIFFRVIKDPLTEL